MLNADIKLDGATAIVEGNWLLVKCWDIKLDSPDRRSTQKGERRALVHGFKDELVVNFNNDYPGGVTIRGEIHIPEKIKQNHLRLESHDLHLDHPDRRSTTGGERRALVHGFNDELVLNWAKDYPGGTVVHGNLEVQKGGEFQLKNSNNDLIISANQWGNLSLGGNGQDGDIILKDKDGKALIHVDTQYKKIDFKDTDGAVKVQINTDQFTESDWPTWAGETVVPQLDLIREIRRMKEEILTLRAEVDELKARP